MTDAEIKVELRKVIDRITLEVREYLRFAYEHPQFVHIQYPSAKTCNKITSLELKKLEEK